jgi:hypothetical protein
MLFDTKKINMASFGMHSGLRNQIDLLKTRCKCMATLLARVNKLGNRDGGPHGFANPPQWKCIPLI